MFSSSAHFHILQRNYFKPSGIVSNLWRQPPSLHSQQIILLTTQQRKLRPIRWDVLNILKKCTNLKNLVFLVFFFFHFSFWYNRREVFSPFLGPGSTWALLPLNVFYSISFSLSVIYYQPFLLSVVFLEECGQESSILKKEEGVTWILVRY